MAILFAEQVKPLKYERNKLRLTVTLLDDGRSTLHSTGFSALLMKSLHLVSVVALFVKFKLLRVDFAVKQCRFEMNFLNFESINTEKKSKRTLLLGAFALLARNLCYALENGIDFAL